MCAQIKQAFALKVLHFCCTVMYVCSDYNASKAKDDGIQHHLNTAAYIIAFLLSENYRLKQQMVFRAI